MCTSVILYRKENYWPLIIGSNRDEKLSRKSKFPGRHWNKHHPQIIGGFDVEEGGSWIAINDYGLFSIIHNSKLKNNNNLKKKSRGQIILDLLNFDRIEKALKSLQNLNQSVFNGFNIIIGNKNQCFWGKHISVDKKIEVREINEGLSILTDKDLNDLMDRKTYYYLNKFSKASIPNPTKNNWLEWEFLLSTNRIENQKNPEEAICFINEKNNFGTRSSSLIAFSNSYSVKQINNPIIFRSTKNSPAIDKFVDVKLK